MYATHPLGVMYKFHELVQTNLNFFHISFSFKFHLLIRPLSISIFLTLYPNYIFGYLFFTSSKDKCC